MREAGRQTERQESKRSKRGKKGNYKGWALLKGGVSQS